MFRSIVKQARPRRMSDRLIGKWGRHVSTVRAPVVDCTYSRHGVRLVSAVQGRPNQSTRDYRCLPRLRGFGTTEGHRSPVRRIESLFGDEISDDDPRAPWRGREGGHVHRYDEAAWSSITVVTRYTHRIIAGPPETRELLRNVHWAEMKLVETEGTVEFAIGRKSRIEFANGYAHVEDDSGCEWWGRYLGPDRSKWIVREE